MTKKLNQVIKKTTKLSRPSYYERGRDMKEWVAHSKAKIQYLKEDLMKEIQAYIREHGTI